MLLLAVVAKGARGDADQDGGRALAQISRIRGVKVTFLGGEPTLYGQAKGNQPLAFLVEAARRLGFEYIRTVTNGIFNPAILLDPRLREIDEITFSVDGHSAEIHDALRGRRTFEKTVRNLSAAVQEGYKVHVTMCAHRGNIGLDGNGEPLLCRSVIWAQAFGVSCFNIHPLFKMGIARDTWTGETDIEPAEWLVAYRELRQRIDNNEFLRSQPYQNSVHIYRSERTPRTQDLRVRLLQKTSERDVWAYEIVVEEWEFLTTHSWLFAKARAIYDRILNAGASALYITKEKLEQAIETVSERMQGAGHEILRGSDRAWCVAR